MRETASKRGGRRPGAGRKPRPERRGFVTHARRPAHAGDIHPVHVTFRAVSRCPFLRSERVFRRVRNCIARAVQRGLRVLHFSVQGNHIHLILEARDRVRLWRLAQGLASGIARAVNRVAGRRGKLWRDRYHRRDLVTARQVRNALVYVLQNFRKHFPRTFRHHSELDPMSSAAWFEGWDSRAGPVVDDVRTYRVVDEVDRAPIAPPRTDLAGVAWRRLGLLAWTESPRS